MPRQAILIKQPNAGVTNEEFKMKAFNSSGPSLALALLCTFLFALPAVFYRPLLGYSEEPQPPAEEVTPDMWPKAVDVGGAKYTVYQPQLDKKKCSKIPGDGVC